MNQKHLPYPPKMRNGGLPPAHLPSPPHFGDAADIVAYLKASVFDKIAALTKAIARRHEADAHEKALANEANKQRRHKAARVFQEAAAARARQEAAITRASQNNDNDYDKIDDDEDKYNGDKDEYDNNDYDEIDDDGDEYDGDKDEYNDNNYDENNDDDNNEIDDDNNE
jgi:hypothetical protein